MKAKVCAVEAKIQLTEQVVDDCVIPHCGATSSSHFELPQSVTTSFSPILEKYKDLFRTSLGHITMDDPGSDRQYSQRIQRPPDRLQM